MITSVLTDKVLSSVWLPAAVRASVKEDEAAERRRRALRRVDSELEKRNYKTALSLVKQLQGKPGGLRGFGAAAEVQRNASSFDELKRSGGVAKSSLQLVIDSILHSVKCSLKFQMLEDDETEGFIQDSGRAMDGEQSSSPYEDHLMCMQHEAGHFLIGYMLGFLPKRYKVPCMEDLLQNNCASGKVEFIGFEFLRNDGMDTLSTRKLSNRKLNRERLRNFSCVLLGGVAAEHLSFGYSELLHSDVQKLDRVLKWLGFTETEFDSVVRRAAEDAVLILRLHNAAQSGLVKAMALGRSVGFCIETIETTLDSEYTTQPVTLRIR